jgi:3,4-dihydroxyphenylacetate 2,3-dioxygenase
MGKLVYAAKITHVPSMYLSELDGPHKGCREHAIEGHHQISKRCRELGVDTIVVFDTHWLVNSGYHINNAAHFKGIYTSNELPHFIKNLPYEYDGNPELGQLIAEAATKAGVHTRAHHDTTLNLEYGTLVPMRYMNEDRHFKVVSIAALLAVHNLDESAKLGQALRTAIEEDYNGNVAIFASGSLSHRFAQNGTADEFLHKVWSPFLEEFDQRVVEMWENGEWQRFTDLLPEYADKCHGEGFMHDTAMLLGALGWNQYKAKAKVISPYFGSSGTGQINVEFPIL